MWLNLWNLHNFIMKVIIFIFLISFSSYVKIEVYVVSVGVQFCYPLFLMKFPLFLYLFDLLIHEWLIGLFMFVATLIFASVSIYSLPLLVLFPEQTGS